ncbi:MAG: hypothetical protein E5Y01_16035 [Mesorhizobium sp.]|uniref:hypothetical protein n=1 Tax=Mesorhizobium sp. TaxID=1871066 RepID=UPI0012295A80|nr:hypothetical protein [Mesorhizobium sp.]TJV51097.1 MAG: hypothetical protein E5Y01_16035 [Mesorhizobium sp.]
MTLDAVHARLAAGDMLHMQLVDGQHVWWFEDPWEQIPAPIADRLNAGGDIVELGDSLFGLAGNSQSWEVSRG